MGWGALARRRRLRRRAPAVLFASLLLHACGDDHVAPAPGPALLPFAQHVIDTHPPGGAECCTDVLATGDLDADGVVDLVVGAEKASGEGLVWYRGPQWQRIGIARGQFTTDAAVWDVDGDGWLDVVASDHGTGIFWYRNPGPTSKGGWDAHRIGAGYAHDLVVADVGVLTCDKRQVVLWRRDGDAWTSEVIRSRPGEGIATADLDRDGLTDVCCGASWLRNPGRPGAPWLEHRVAAGWPADTRVRTADVDADGRVDLVLSASEGPGRIAWFRCPDDPASAPWLEHLVWDDELRGVHGLRVVDVDLDGDLDIVVAEMHTSPQRRVAICYQDGPDLWRPVILARSGSHNLAVVDLDADGDPDIVGKNYAGADRVLETWENLVIGKRAWCALAIDRERPDDQIGKTGSCFGDLDGDGRIDVVAGSFAYLNPGGDLSGRWVRERLPGAFDAHFFVDVDQDQDSDLVGFDGQALVWAERSADGWHTNELAELPKGRTQGQAVGPLIAGGRDELVFTRGKRLFFATLPDPADADRWDVRELSDDNEEEGIALADLDGDGDLDVFAQDHSGHLTVCYANPGGDGRGTWRRSTLAASHEWLDRIAVADFDGDGRFDVVTTEETQDWTWNASVYLLTRSDDGAWHGTAIARLRSVNSLGVGDVDGDGDPDIVIAEHTDQRSPDGAPDNITAALLNDDHGRAWRTEWIDVGPRSSHLGAKLVDLDGDGDLDVVSTAWRQGRMLHLWRNDRPR